MLCVTSDNTLLVVIIEIYKKKKKKKKSVRLNITLSEIAKNVLHIDCT